jgi:hypothetical protein
MSEGDEPMTTWTSDELTAIGSADEVQIAPLRRDGTPRTPVPIWIVRDGGQLYIRSYRGAEGAWYRAARSNGAGHIRADGVAKNVTFEAETDPETNGRIDAAYRSKYARYGASYVTAMTSEEARATTLKLNPR